MKRTTPLTGFGRLVRDLMESRGLLSWRDLRNRLVEDGWSGSATTVTNYLIGKHHPPPAFVAHLTSALDLTEEEKKALARAYAYESQPENATSQSA